MKSNAEQNAQCRIREHHPGDLGWIVYRHGAVYAQEYGYDETFEAVVAQIAADFLRFHDASRERCWIAEFEGEKVGSIMLVKLSDDLARLRVMLVEPAARGRGIGQALVRECVAFARAAGYRKVTLWTHASLIAARRLYERAGFRLAHSGPATEGFGCDLIDETWELEL
jgi:GNAT superfamily N-acetyltransferase